MYEDVTYEVILDRMLGRVKDDCPGIDTRQSSPVYTALAPAAVEFQNAYIGLDWVLAQIFAGTAARENLVRRCAEWGITPNPATKAVLKGEFNRDIELGSRFSMGTLNYAAVERLSEGVYRMECESAGKEGNRGLGLLVPIFYIPDLTRAELTEVLEDGAGEESTEALLERFLSKIQKPSTSGNRYDYFNWAMECAGVGAAKVFPLSDGPGTVKVVIADANISAADAGLVKRVRDHIEELRPIGADVTVASVKEKAVNVSAGIRLRLGMNLGAVQSAFQDALTDYLRKESLGMSYVSLARVGNLLLGTVGVEDYSGLLLNGTSENIGMAEEEIAVAGNVALEVM